MSTTFGIYMIGTEVVSISDDTAFDNAPLMDEVEVARRIGGEIQWTNSLAHLLPDNTKVEPLDNTAQGIYTIGDIRECIKKQDNDLSDN
jgi:hypothetical protein